MLTSRSSASQLPVLGSLAEPRCNPIPADGRPPGSAAGLRSFTLPCDQRRSKFTVAQASIFPTIPAKNSFVMRVFHPRPVRPTSAPEGRPQMGAVAMFDRPIGRCSPSAGIGRAVFTAGDRICRCSHPGWVAPSTKIVSVVSLLDLVGIAAVSPMHGSLALGDFLFSYGDSNDDRQFCGYPRRFFRYWP